MAQQFFVVPITHIDLAWKRGREEMCEMLEIVVIRLLDALEHNPRFKYLIEQAAHFRELQKRRPDLIARLKPFLQSGRLEFVGAMASTLENNLPNGECFVRNQQMGLQWVRETWGLEVQTGWLIDTFGLNAQVPQILRGFGMAQLMANTKSAAFDDSSGAIGQTKLTNMEAFLTAAQGGAVQTPRLIEEKKDPALAQQHREEFRRRIDYYESQQRPVNGPVIDGRR